jgi:hypothetical protein
MLLFYAVQAVTSTKAAYSHTISGPYFTIVVAYFRPCDYQDYSHKASDTMNDKWWIGFGTDSNWERSQSE